MNHELFDDDRTSTLTGAIIRGSELMSKSTNASSCNMLRSLSLLAVNRGGNLRDVNCSAVSPEREPEDMVELLKLLEPKTNPYFELDRRAISVKQRMENRMREHKKGLDPKAPTTPKPQDNVSETLKDLDKRLEELKGFGDKLITNVIVAHRQFMLHNTDLHRTEAKGLARHVIENHLELMASYDELMARWQELGASSASDGLAFFESIQSLREQTEALIGEKQKLLDRCKAEVASLNAFFEETQAKHMADIQHCVLRCVSQAEIMRDFYHNESQTFLRAIFAECDKIIKRASDDFDIFMGIADEDQYHKLEKVNTKKEFLRDNLERIDAEEKQKTRLLRIQLENEADKLMLETQSQFHQLTLNFAKMNYNYLLYQHQAEERIQLKDYLKRRVFELRKAINDTKKEKVAKESASAEQQARLINDVLQLHAKISKMEQTMLVLRAQNQQQYDKLCRALKSEATDLCRDIYRIDRAIFEQQLDLPWPGEAIELNDEASPTKKNPDDAAKAVEQRRQQMKRKSLLLRSTKTSLHLEGLKRAHDMPYRPAPTKDDGQDIRLLRNILWRLSERGGFLVDGSLPKILAPYSIDSNVLIRVDSIFQSLNLAPDLRNLPILLEAFRPYASCPNCGEPRRKALVGTGADQEMARISKWLTETTDESVDADETSEKTLHPLDSDASLTAKVPHTVAHCPDHHLGIPPNLVLKALCDFVQKQVEKQKQLFLKQNNLKGELFKIDFKQFIANNILVRPSTRESLPKIVHSTRSSAANAKLQQHLADAKTEAEYREIKNYWQKFSKVLPSDRQRVWDSLKQGLECHIEALKKKSKLSEEIEVLKRQNQELKFLLQKQKNK